jgi:hypothetical protein
MLQDLYSLRQMKAEEDGGSTEKLAVDPTVNHADLFSSYYYTVSQEALLLCSPFMPQSTKWIDIDTRLPTSSTAYRMQIHSMPSSPKYLPCTLNAPDPRQKEANPLETEFTALDRKTIFPEFSEPKSPHAVSHQAPLDHHDKIQWLQSYNKMHQEYNEKLHYMPQYPHDPNQFKPHQDNFHRLTASMPTSPMSEAASCLLDLYNSRPVVQSSRYGLLAGPSKTVTLPLLKPKLQSDTQTDDPSIKSILQQTAWKHNLQHMENAMNPAKSDEGLNPAKSDDGINSNRFELPTAANYLEKQSFVDLGAPRASSERIRVHMCHHPACFRIFPSRSRLQRHEATHSHA